MHDWVQPRDVSLGATRLNDNWMEGECVMPMPYEPPHTLKTEGGTKLLNYPKCCLQEAEYSKSSMPSSKLEYFFLTQPKLFAAATPPKRSKGCDQYPQTASLHATIEIGNCLGLQRLQVTMQRTEFVGGCDAIKSAGLKPMIPHLTPEYPKSALKRAWDACRRLTLAPHQLRMAG